MIRSSKIYFDKILNYKKNKRLELFLLEYRRVAQLYLDYIWNNEIKYKNKVFNIKSNQLAIPQFLSKSESPIIVSPLSARALKCCLTQVLGIISAVTEKRRKSLWIKENREKNGLPLYKSLDKSLSKELIKPSIDRIKPELNSICADFKENNSGEFNGFLSLKSLGKIYGKIRIPIQYNRQANKWRAGKLKNSFLISENYIVFRYEILKTKKTSGEILGADTGLKTVITLSNGLSTPKTDSHGHCLEAIINKISRKKKGSKAFKKAQEHRRNFIHWSINQLNLQGVKQINLEEIKNINFGRRASRKMQAWANSIIEDKVISYAEEQEVLVVLQSSAYRSQRCSKCGLVRKSNRKGEIYCCSCGNTMNADLNAARNHAIKLPPLPFEFRMSKDLKEFYWNPENLKTGTEFTVPTSKYIKETYIHV